MAVYHIYADESGKLGGNADRTSFCGYVGHVGMWQAFDAAWKDCCFKWQVPPIHMSRIMCPHDKDTKDDAWTKVKVDWGNQWEGLRPRLLHELSEIIFESRIICVGAVVDANHFRSLCAVDPNFKALHHDPIHMSFHTLLMGAIDRIEMVDKLSPIGLVIDNDAEFAKGVYDQFENLKQTAQYHKCDAEMARRFARIKERVHSISFVNDDSYPGVQAADMIAYEARRTMVERIANPTYTSELYDKLTFGRFHQPKFYTAEALDGLHEELKKGIADGSITF
jgi:uncharacterized protein DUF3800